MIWNAVMSAVEWNKKEELVYEQVCRIDPKSDARLRIKRLKQQGVCVGSDNVRSLG